MKKLLCFTLTAVLAAAMAAPALAAPTFADDTKTLDKKTPSDTTDVQFSVQPTYTVTIPATVQLGKVTAQDGTVTYENDLTVTASNVRLKAGEKLGVAITNTDFKLRTQSGPYTLDYNVTVDDKTVAVNDKFAVYETSTTDQTTTLHFSAKNPDFAGDYSDKVTFTLTVVDTKQTGNGDNA